MAMTCKLCGTEIKENETVCSLCGTAVENTSVPAVEETSAPVVETPAPTVEEVKPESVATVPAAESKFVCSGCGKEYSAGTKFCAECGGKVEEKKPVIIQRAEAPKFVCTGCGKEYPAGTKFCSECGGKVEEVKPAAPEVFACVGCGKEYPAGTKFCAECGGKVEVKSAAPVKKIVCTKCGKEYPDGGKFCSECGGKIEEKIINSGNSQSKIEVKEDVHGLFDVVLTDVNDEDKAGVLLMLTEVLSISNQEAKKIVDTRSIFENCVLVRANCPKDEAESLAKKIKFACSESIKVEVECIYAIDKYVKMAISAKTIEELRDALEHGVDINLKNCYYYYNFTLLHSAAENGGYLDIVKYLVSLGADVEAKNRDGETPLYNAAVNGYLDIVKYLVSQGADIEARDDKGRTPLCRTVGRGHLDIVKYLVGLGADIEARDDEGYTSLCYAFNAATVEFLLGHGADIEATNNEGNTPLLYHSSFHCERKEKIVDVLLKHGANVHATNDYEETALHRAAENDFYEAIVLLLKYGADVNAENDGGATPLDCAIERGCEECINLLKQHGAVANFKHETTMTAAEIVEEYFPSAKMKFSSTLINFAPNFPMCTTPPHEDTIAIIVDDYVYTFINKSGIYIRPKTEGSGAANRFFSNLFDGARQPVDLPWEDITSMVYNHDRPGKYDNIEINNTTAWLGDDKAIALFAKDLIDFARMEGANV